MRHPDCPGRRRAERPYRGQTIEISGNFRSIEGPGSLWPEAVRRRLLAEGTADLIRQGLHQIRHDRSVTMLTKVWTGTSRTSLTLPRRVNLVCRHCDSDRIVALAGALIHRDVCRNLRNAAENFRRGTKVKCGKSKRRALPELDLVDV